LPCVVQKSAKKEKAAAKAEASDEKPASKKRKAAAEEDAETEAPAKKSKKDRKAKKAEQAEDEVRPLGPGAAVS